MEKQLRHFAGYVDRWASSTLQSDKRLEDVLTWYSGNMPLPHPEWGPAETFYQAALLTHGLRGWDAPTKNALSLVLADALKFFAGKPVWSEIEKRALNELLITCFDLSPQPCLFGPAQALLAHKQDSLEPALTGALREALIFNQDDASLSSVWLALLRGENQGCLPPAPHSDIRGLCRLGTIGKPEWPTIAEGIGLFAKRFEAAQERRQLLRRVWQDLADAWGKEDLLQSEWNWNLIVEGAAASWPKWVFETLPSLYGRVPGETDKYFAWEPVADAFSKLIRWHEAVPHAPVYRISWAAPLSPRNSEALKQIEDKRRTFTIRGSEGLPEIIYKEAAGLTKHIQDQYIIGNPTTWLNPSQRMRLAAEDFAEAQTGVR